MQPYMVAYFQQQGKGELGHRIGRIGRHIAHRDPPAGSGGAIYHIVAGGKDANQLDAGAGIQNGGIDGVMVRTLRRLADALNVTVGELF